MPLINALKDRKWGSTRWIAAWALGEIGESNAVKTLITALCTWDKGVRKRAAEALGKMNWRKVIRGLIGL